MDLDLAGYFMHEQISKVEGHWPGDARVRLASVARGLMLDFLLTSGGVLKRPVVIEEQVYEVRLWDLAGRVDLGLGAQASYLLEHLQQAIQDDHPVHLPLPDLANGEMFFYHALHLRLLKDLSLRRFCSSLRRSSPLTRLCKFPIVGERSLVRLDDGTEGRPALSQEEMRGLLLHPVLPFLLGYLADQWANIEPPDPQVDLEVQLERINTRRATLTMLMDELETLGRFSLLIVLPLFFTRLLRQRYHQQVATIRNFKQWRLSLREQLLFAHAGLFRLGEQLDQIYRRQVVEPGPYGWSHPMEIRTFAGKYGRLWASGGLREEVRQAERQLRQEIG